VQVLFRYKPALPTPHGRTSQKREMLFQKIISASNMENSFIFITNNLKYNIFVWFSISYELFKCRQ
jgi:hypothetical protein